MERKAVSGIMLILLLISMLTLALPILLTLAEPETRLYIDPLETKVSVGDTFIIDVNLDDVIDLYGYDIWLSYNTSFLDVISVDPPHLLPEPMIEIIEPDGIIHIYKILFPPEPFVSGSGTLASITFNATALGSGILDLFDTTLVDSHLSPISHTVIDGLVTVLSTIHDHWAVIEDVNGDRLKVETASDEIWSTLIELYHNRSERWIGGIVEKYDNKWGFRFDPNTIIVAEVVIEVWQTTIRGISENLDYWLGGMACVGAKVVEINPLRVPDDYPTIQEAINAASDGGTILVASGTYHENIVINKMISLVGENRNITFITGYYIYQWSVVSILASGVWISGFTIQNGWAGVGVYSSGCTITENRITNNTYRGGGPQIYESGRGIWLSSSKNTTIIQNIVDYNDRNISLKGAENNSIESNTILRSLISWGIVLEGSPNNTISDNVVKYSVYDGIYLSRSDSNSIIGNSVMNNGDDGIYLGRSNNNSLIGNTITNNQGEGIWLDWSSGNTVVGNTITNNKKRGILVWHSEDSTIYHNNFINNSWGQAYSNLINTWDDGYPSGGNYWSDYAGEDNYSGSNQDKSGSDGIGDTPYTIDINNQDSYPLMKPYGGPHDIGITVVTTSKTVVGQGYSLNMTVIMLNYGIYTEDRNVTVYANTTAIASQNVTLTSRNSTTITFTWNTTGFAYGNYTISAHATPVLDETDIADNTLANGAVMVTIPGDANGDRIVDIYDIGYISAQWYPGPPIGPLGYDANADINGDGAVDKFDIGITSASWGQSW